MRNGGYPFFPFCPSCHQKRVVEFGEWLCSHVLRLALQRHVVFSSRRSCAGIFSMTGIFFPIRVAAPANP